MQPRQNIDTQVEQEAPFEVVIGLFESHEHAGRAAASLRGPDLVVQKISKQDPAVPGHLPSIVYEDIDHIDGDHVVSGSLLGGTIGIGSGLLLFAVSGMSVAAPIAGGLVGAWIGGIAGIDEANRGIELPDPSDYREMLNSGKSLVVIAGDESLRKEYEKKLSQLGAEQVFQHPPVRQVVR